MSSIKEELTKFYKEYKLVNRSLVSIGHYQNLSGIFLDYNDKSLYDLWVEVDQVEEVITIALSLEDDSDEARFKVLGHFGDTYISLSRFVNRFKELLYKNDGVLPKDYETVLRIVNAMEDTDIDVLPDELFINVK